MILLAVTATVFLSISFSSLGDYQNWGGDFAQYVTQARNLLWGRPWAMHMEGYPAIMPGYPALLSISALIGGDSLHSYAITNSLLWLATSGLFFLTVRALNPQEIPILGAIAASILLLNPFIIGFQQMIQPNIFFSFCIWLYLYVLTKYEDVDEKRIYVLLFFLLILCGVVRTTFLAMSVSTFFFAAYKRRWWLTLVPMLATILIILVEILLAKHGGQDTNFQVFLQFFDRSAPLQQGGRINGVFVFLLDFLRMMTSFLSAQVNAIIPTHSTFSAFNVPYTIKISGKGVLNLHILLVPMLVFFGTGLFQAIRQRGLSLLEIYFVVHLGLISTFIQPGIPDRYILPILPIFVYYSVVGIFHLLPKAPYIRVAVSSVIIISFLAVSLCSLKESMELPKKDNRLDASVREASSWLRENCGSFGQVAFFKVRTMRYLLDGSDHGCSNEIVEHRDPKRAYAWLQNNNIILVPKHFGKYKQDEILTALQKSDSVKIIWENSAIGAFVKTTNFP